MNYIDLTIAAGVLIAASMLSYSQGRLDEIRHRHREWLRRTGYLQLTMPEERQITRRRRRLPTIRPRASRGRAPWAAVMRLLAYLRP